MADWQIHHSCFKARFIWTSSEKYFEKMLTPFYWNVHLAHLGFSYNSASGEYSS